MKRRVVILGAGAGGLPAANRLVRSAGGDAPEVVLVDRAAEHVFAPGYVAVMFGDAEPDAFRRPLAELADPRVRLVRGEVTGIDPDAATVTGSFGDLAYDELVIALGADVGWPDGPPAAGELAPWTLAGALAGRETMRRLSPRDRVVLGPMGGIYRCPPAVFDLAVRIRRQTGAEVEVVHPWPRPLAPFGEAPASAFTSLLATAGVRYTGGFTVAEVRADAVVSSEGAEAGFGAAFIVPPHRPPAVVAGSPLAGPAGWPEVSYPSLTHPAYPNVSVIGDLAGPALRSGLAGTLAVFQAAHVADRILAGFGGRPAPGQPQMSAICFADPGHTGSFLHCDFAGPAAGTGPAACTLMPWLPYFRRAKRLFAEEWFASMLAGEVG